MLKNHIFEYYITQKGVFQGYKYRKLLIIFCEYKSKLTMCRQEKYQKLFLKHGHLLFPQDLRRVQNRYTRTQKEKDKAGNLPFFFSDLQYPRRRKKKEKRKGLFLVKKIAPALLKLSDIQQEDRRPRCPYPKVNKTKTRKMHLSNCFPNHYTSRYYRDKCKYFHQK